MNRDPLRLDAAKTDKVIRLIDFLLKVATLRSKAIRDLEQYEKVLWLSNVPREQGCCTPAWGDSQNQGTDVWLEVQNRPKPPMPPIPSCCQEWVPLSALSKKDEEPRLLRQITRQIANPKWQPNSDLPETIPQVTYLEQHPEVQRAWQQYLTTAWLPWRQEHNAWEALHKVYSTLFSIHQSQIRLGEEYELVLGLGLLLWQSPSGQRIRRHLIVADADLEFDAQRETYSVRPHPDGARLRLELEMLDAQNQSPQAELAAKTKLANCQDDPWDTHCIEQALKEIIHRIDARAIYDPTLDPTPHTASETPVVLYAPALILRKRSTRGLTETLTQMKRAIEPAKGLTFQFADLAEVIQPADEGASNDTSVDQPGMSDMVFFPKPYNAEQRRIVETLRQAPCVLVQGPPGTGKSHTIANLICHLLATGQRALITAKTPRALQVLERLLPEELRPLCIYLLGNATEERRSLETSVQRILSKNQEWNSLEAATEAERIVQTLGALREEKAAITARLRAIRERETCVHTIAAGAYRGTAAQIAAAVNEQQARYGWFIDVVPPDRSCPINKAALHKLLRSLRDLTAEVRAEVRVALLPDAPPLEHVRGLFIKEAETGRLMREKESAPERQLADRLSCMPPLAIDQVMRSLVMFQQTISRLSSIQDVWAVTALNDVLSGASHLWHELARAMHDSFEIIARHVPRTEQVSLEIPAGVDRRQLCEDASELHAHLLRHGGFGWRIFRPRQLRQRLSRVQAVKLAGCPCHTAEQFALLRDVLRVRLELEKLSAYWAPIAKPLDGPDSLQLAEMRTRYERLELVLRAQQIVEECKGVLQQCSGFPEPVWTDPSQIALLIQACRLATAVVEQRSNSEEVRQVEARLLAAAEQPGAHPVAKELLIAFRSRDLDAYQRGLAWLTVLKQQQQHLQKDLQKLDTLARVLPKFAEALEQTPEEPYWDERIETIEDAWHWAQARRWIAENIGEDDAHALVQRAKQIDDEISEHVARLAALHAWRVCFDRLREDHRRHMESWQLAMRRLGKGTGKHAHRYRTDAQKHLSQCREAVPAWVMPLHRVWDTVTAEPGIFDVIIVDEASQCGLEALPLLYLGKKLVIVGDDKQISPEVVGVERETVQHITEQYLHDFVLKSTFDIESSLFDHAKVRYAKTRITLREHFRCMPEIIRFSNDLCYSDTPLIPLRQFGADRLPPLEHVYVSGGYREGEGNRVINPPEARAVVDRIVSMCHDDRYQGKTMGVVVLQGEAQASVIESLLLERLGAAEMERRRLVCGNPYSFQGDERDVILLSLVAASNERIGPLTKATDQRRFNVAASRARDQMILFHSVTREQLSSLDLRRRLLEFFEGIEVQQIGGVDQEELERRAALDNRSLVRPPTPFDSWFEVDVALELVRRGYVVRPQYEIAGRRIDLVVEGGSARLAVECDGDHWHGAEQYEQDMQRQQQLERCGWEFFRVRASLFYANRTEALSRLWGMLEERGIYPHENRAALHC